MSQEVRTMVKIPTSELPIRVPAKPMPRERR